MHSPGRISEPDRAGSAGYGGCFRGQCDSGTPKSRCYMGSEELNIRFIRPLFVIDRRGSCIVFRFGNVLP